MSDKFLSKLIEIPGKLKISGFAELALGVAVVAIGVGASKFLSRSSAKIKGRPKVTINGFQAGSASDKKKR